MNENEEYLGSLKELMNHKGWKYLIEDLKQDLIGLNNLDNVSNVEELYFRKGQAYIMQALIHYEARLELSQDDSI